MKLNCAPELIHLHGPLGIHSYGLFIALGITIGITASRYNKRFKQLHLENVYLDIIMVSIIAGVVGGRVLAVISEPFLYPHWYDWFAFWQGGYSILGTIIGVVAIVPLYLKKLNIPIIPFFDLAAIYAPLCQSIARLGCFTAGCCYGITTESGCAVIYTNPYSLAPHNIAIHPTQLYSSALLLCIFLIMYFIGQRICKNNGDLFVLYLTLASLERFFVDFWRADRIMIGNFLSFHQIVALCIITALIIFRYFITTINTNNLARSS